jgi:hypothetical protein
MINYFLYHYFLYNYQFINIVISYNFIYIYFIKDLFKFKVFL